MATGARMCRGEAYDYFAEQVRNISETRSLLRAAVAISLHALDDYDPNCVEAQLDLLADRIKERVRHGGFDAKWAHLHQVLFDEEQFEGNRERYYCPSNSYLPVVLGSRKGLPISLALIYKYVAEQIGLEVVGINSPGHFLVQVCDGDRRILVDPFSGGQVLTRMEFLQRLGVEPDAKGADYCFQVASHRQWLSRMLNNLQMAFKALGWQGDRQAMLELSGLLHGSCD